MYDHPDIIIVRMTALLVSRFLLDLQAASQKSLKLARDDPLYSSRMDGSENSARGTGSLVFAGFDVVGSLGASLAPSEDEEFGETDNLEEPIEDDTALRERDAGAEAPTLEEAALVGCVEEVARSSV